MPNLFGGHSGAPHEMEPGGSADGDEAADNERIAIALADAGLAIQKATGEGNE